MRTSAPPLSHHLDLRKYRHNTRTATIALISTSPTTILPHCSARLPVLYKESHHFFRPSFFTQQLSQGVGAKKGKSGNVSVISIFIAPFSLQCCSFPRCPGWWMVTFCHPIWTRPKLKVSGLPPPFNPFFPASSSNLLFSPTKFL